MLLADQLIQETVYQLVDLKADEIIEEDAHWGYIANIQKDYCTRNRIPLNETEIREKETDPLGEAWEDPIH